MKDPENWLDAILPFPRPEYAKQTESLLTDLIWRSEGSSLSHTLLFEKLGEINNVASHSINNAERLVLRRRHGGSAKLTETLPLAEATDISSLLVCAGGTPAPTKAILQSVLAPRARGDKSDACVPVHPDLVALQTLHGLVNKEGPSNLALGIETMGWLGGALSKGQVAATFLEAFKVPTPVRSGATGFMEQLLPTVAKHVWAAIPDQFNVTIPNWPAWPVIVPNPPTASVTATLAAYKRTPFAWFWRKWTNLCDPAKNWHDVLPARRFVDWAMCLLRTGLAFSYLWEAEFFLRLRERVVWKLQPVGVQGSANRMRSMLLENAVLAAFEPPTVPASQKGIWPAMSELLAKGYEARRRIYDLLDGDGTTPAGASAADVLDGWVQGLSPSQMQILASPLQVQPRTANNQKEFVRYLLLPRSSDDDLIDQADFYYLARTNSRHVWFHPGPEWLVVITSLLCETPGGICTLGALVEDLASLGIKVERSVLVGLLEEAGLTTDSPDADNALVIRSGF